MLLHTIGHSNRPLADFLTLLAENNIKRIADVRRFPGSRRHPQFGRDSLAASLAEANIGYAHFPALGGRRRKLPFPLGEGRGEGSASSPLPPRERLGEGSSPNSAWKVAAFAAYADYMQTADFARAVTELESLATRSPTAIMCAEALPWQCHRRLIADHFLVQGWQVLDIIGPNNTKPHELPDFAAVVGGRVTYPGTPRPLFDN